MKSFFEREEKRLDSTTQRMSGRASEKKKLESSKLEPKKKVSPPITVLTV